MATVRHVARVFGVFLVLIAAVIVLRAIARELAVMAYEERAAFAKYAVERAAGRRMTDEQFFAWMKSPDGERFQAWIDGHRTRPQ